MKCYICVSAPSEHESSSIYQNLLKACLSSAKANTTLKIVALYDGNISDGFYKILQDYNVEIIRHRFSRFSSLPKTYSMSYIKENFHKEYFDYNKLAGTFMRFDIPFIEKEEEYVLYCDFDVIFLKDISAKELQKPKYFLAGPEFDKNDELSFNAGILYLNVNSMKKICNQIFLKLESGIPNSIGLFDQGYLFEVAARQYEKLPIEFNWKPYWGYNPDARILHFHGIKPDGNTNNSGFNTTDEFYSEAFNKFSQLPEYVINLNIFYYYLNSRSEDWICNHIKKILTIMFLNRVKFRRKIYIYFVKNILTLFLIKKYRNKFSKYLLKYKSLYL